VGKQRKTKVFVGGRFTRGVLRIRRTEALIQINNTPFENLLPQKIMKLNWKTLFLLTTCCTLGLMTTVRAQVSSDGTLSTTVANPDNLNFTINNGNRVGGNLFHSFREFSVPNGGSAVFQNAADVQNIISRVTGGSLSQINGLIQAQGSANLFLLNPAGISFGQNARLSIGGSFFATTADSLLFGDGIEFSATNPQAPLLTVNIPIGLRFRDNPGNITNQSVVQENNSPVGLQVNPGNSLALVGGNVSLEQGGRLTAAGGRIELGGLAGAGTVGLQTTGNTFTLNFPTNGLSNVSLLDDARVAVRSNGGGEIVVNTNIFTATNGGRLVGGIEGIAPSATRNGGDITVNSNEFNISGVGLQSEFAAGIAQQVLDGASGNTGNIFVNTKSFNASSGAQLQNTVLFTGTGNAGNISITSNLLSLTNAVINSSTSGIGNAGNISLQVGDAIALSDSSLITANVQTGGSGTGGDIDIRARSLTLTNGSQIQAGLFRRVGDIPGGIGTGGSIKINATDFIDISGFNPVSQLQSGIFAPAETGSTGPGGSIDITTGAFRLTNFGVVIAGNDNGNNGGDITINAKTFEATNGQVQTILIGQAEADGLFSAGDIQLNVTDSVSLKDGSLINSSTFGRGNAGNISLQVGDAIAFTNGSQINSSTSGQGNAGNISLQVGDAIALSDSSFIITNVQPGGSGIGGDIDIRARSLTLTNASQIQAALFRQDSGLPGGNGTGGSIKINASDFIDISGLNPVSGLQSGIFAPAETGSTGPGGSIDITTGAFRLTNFGVVTARNDNGNNGGDITINAKTFEATNGLVQTILSGQAEAGRLFSAGDIQLNVTDSLSLKDGSLINSSTFGRGNAGNISLQVGNAIALTNGAQINSSTSGIGDAGDISLQVGDAIALSDSSFITTNVQPGGSGISGDIDIRARSLTLTNASQIQAALFRQDSGLPGGIGTGGSIKINASDFIDISGFNPVSGLQSGIFTPAETGSTGPGGSIDITTGAFRLSNFGIVTAGTANGNNGGDITINAKTFEATNGQVQTILSGQAEAGRLFSAGDIKLNVTDSVSLKDGSLINSSTSGIGNAGNVTINASDISLNGAGSAISSSVAVGATGKGGDIDIQTRILSLTNGAEILATTEGNGIAGNIRVNATDSIFLNGVAPIVLPDGSAGGFSSGLFSNSDQANSGAGGQILVETPNLRILDGGVISARSRSAANAGNITVNSQNVELRGGGQILATAFNGGNAGNIDVTADNITISGADPTLNTRFNQVAQQFGRDIAERRIDPVQPESGIFVNSTGTGQGGNLSITGNSLSLDRGIINASTQSANGGNINLRLRNFIRLRNESLISANAGGQQSGNGGNITINTPFIVAFPQNNDIIANARSGNSGRITINPSAILFGIDPLRRADLRRLLGDDNLDPRRLSTSDITAFSEQNSNFPDNVQVTSPDVDPSRGLVELPETVSDPTQKVAQNPCRQGIGNEFFVTGRGGLPTDPNQTLSSDNVRVDLLQPVASSGNSGSATKKPVTTVTATRVPAQGWIFNDKGQVVLTAYDPTNTGSQRSFSTAAACPAR
jgi:filamentous hemagglutinin family protein